jgi:hypothetical protein
VSVGRGRLALAALVVLAGTAVPARASYPEGDDLTDQAATFGIRAIAHAGLLDPLGQYYGYDGIVRPGERWVMSFGSSTCYRNERVETCDPNTGTRDEPQTDAWLEIALEDDHFVVTDAIGRFTDDDEAALRSYSEPATIEETHLEFPTVRLDRSMTEDGWEIRAAMLWAGPLFVRGVWSVCTPVIYDHDGNVIWTGSAFADSTRRGEYFRSNGLFGAGAVELDEEPARADIVCELWTKETWTPAGEPEIRRSPSKGHVLVEAPLQWEHEPVAVIESRCRVELRRRDGSVLEAEVVRGPVSPWAGRRRKETLYAQVDVARPRAVATAAVECVARGQSFGAS